MQTLKALIDHRAKTDPDRVYLITPESGREMTYSALRENARKIAAFLRQKGLRKGDKICLMVQNGYQTANLYLGAIYGGFVAAPVNLVAQSSYIQYVLDHSDCTLVLVSKNEDERLRSILKNIDRDIPKIVMDVDEEGIVEWGDHGSAETESVDEEDEALLIYTSGTTGRPKGVLLTHKNVLAGGHFSNVTVELTPDDRVLGTLPLYHINGLIGTLIGPIVHGGSVVLPHGFAVSNFWELVSEYQCTWFNLVPTTVSYLLSRPDQRVKSGELRLDQVRFARSSSSALPPSVHRAFEKTFGINLIERMGMTETTGPILCNPLDPAKRKYGSPGLPIGSELKVVDPDDNTLGPNQIGELMVRGDNVMKGYYKMPEITAEAISSDGWYRTGDLGQFDDDGYFFVTGRLKELIIKGGENIAPREIDEVLYKHPAIMEAATIGIPDKHYGQEVMACVTLKPGHSCSEQELQVFCRKELGHYKSPKIIKFLDSLPKGPSGKLQRLKLSKEFEISGGMHE